MLTTLLADLQDMATATSWMDWGSCIEVDPEAFFPTKGESTRPAKTICAACPIREECLEYAIEHDIQWGIWGGLTLKQRRRVKQLSLAA